MVPIYHGFILGSKIKEFPFAGKVITNFIVQTLKDRKEKISVEDMQYVARDIKKNICYFTKDIIEEYSKEKKDGQLIINPRFKRLEGIGQISKKPFSIDIGYESFLAPELYFSPEMIDKKYNQPLDEMIDSTIQACPVTIIPKMYNNIILSGYSTHLNISKIN